MENKNEEELLKYISKKHSTLNRNSSKYGDKLLEILKGIHDTLTKDIRKKEKCLAFVRFSFVLVFVTGMIGAGIYGLMHPTEITKDMGMAGGAVASELAIYQAIVHPVRSSISVLEGNRNVISNEITAASKNISVALLKEQDLLTKTLTRLYDDKKG